MLCRLRHSIYKQIGHHLGDQLDIGENTIINNKNHGDQLEIVENTIINDKSLGGQLDIGENTIIN